MPVARICRGCCAGIAAPVLMLTRDEGLESIAQDIVRHCRGRGFVGKAMVVSIDNATALKVRDEVRKHWVAEAGRVSIKLGRFRPNAR